MTAKDSFKHGGYGLFQHLLFLYKEYLFKVFFLCEEYLPCVWPSSFDIS